jgi:hypothetical protein
MRERAESLPLHTAIASRVVIGADACAASRAATLERLLNNARHVMVRKPKILLVVDDATLTTSYKSALCVAGFEVAAPEALPADETAGKNDCAPPLRSPSTPTGRRGRPARRRQKPH